MFVFDRAVSLQLDLRAAPGAAAPAGFDVRELGRAEVEPVLRGTALARPLAELDAVAPSGWRCFAAFADGAPVHVTFVELRPGRPLAFGEITVPLVRGRGAFRATMALVAARLREEGHTTLFAAVSGANRASLRAQAVAGFVVVRRTYDVRVGGVSLRAFARRLLRGR